MNIHTSVRQLQIAFGVFLVVLTSFTYAEGVFYFGSGIGLENFKTRYDQRADTDLFPTLSLRDLVFSDRDGGDDTLYSLNAFIGLRVDLNARSVWFGIQAETLFRSEFIEGRLAGVGTDTDGTEIQNLLEQNWTLQTERDRTLVLRIGTVVSFLGILDFSPYILVGLREVEIAFERELEICGTNIVCQPDEQGTPVTEQHKPSLRQLVFGVGIEKYLREKTSISFEARYSNEDDEKWIGTTNDISTPSSLSSDSYDISLKLSIYL